MENGNQTLKQYLLGNLGGREAEELDLQLIADANLEEKLDCAESELMEDYLDDALSAAEVESFETNFLVSPARKAHLRQISMLKKYAGDWEAKNICAEEKSPAASAKTFFARLGEFFSPKLQIAAAALALLVVSMVGVFFYAGANQPTALEKEFARLNQNDLSDLAEYKNAATVNLFSGIYRGADGAGKLAIDKSSDRVLFRLALPVAAIEADLFKIQVSYDGKVVFTQNQIRFYNNPNGQELRFFLPAPILKKGEYQIKAKKINAADDSAVLYDFAVQ